MPESREQILVALDGSVSTAAAYLAALTSATGISQRTRGLRPGSARTLGVLISIRGIIVEVASDLLAKALRGNYPVALTSMEGFATFKEDRTFGSAKEILSVVEPMLVELDARLTRCEAMLK